MGRFGQHLCKYLAEHGNQVMIIDQDEEKLEPVLEYATSSKIGDCTNVDVLTSLGLNNFDVVFICIGTDFQSSLEATSLVKEMGAKKVVSKATRDIQAKFLLRNGADEIIYPERDVAKVVAVTYSSENVFDYIEITEDYVIFEITPLPAWVGKSLSDLNVRNTRDITIIGIKTEGKGAPKIMPKASHIIQEHEHLILVCSQESMNLLLKELS